jgi:tetratricopeptide (TPR) repeat protein
LGEEIVSVDVELRRSKQLEFLLIVLRSVHEHNGTPDVIYALLRQNLDLLDLDITEVLKNWANAKFTEIDRDQQELIIMDIINLGNLIQQFPLGNKAVKIECSLECCSLALKVFTISKDPKIWAVIQNILAIAYSERIRDDLAENLERSIECFRSALEVYTQTDFPIDWAMTQNNLAIAYRKRIRGNRVENLERSIECYLSALKVYTPESFPREWAITQVGLARFSIETLQNYQFATEHLQSAYAQLSENNNDTGLLAQTMFELARCFHKTGSLGQAKLYFKDSIRLYQRLEQPTQVAAATSALGNLELQMGAIDDARIHLQTALEFYQAAGNLDRVASIQELQQYLPEYSPEPAI